VVSVAMEAVEMVPALPKIPALPPHDGHTHVPIESNAPQLAAAAARRDEASHWEHRLQGAVAEQAEHNQAEARSLLARAREVDARRRTDRLGSMAVWAFVPLMRAFRGWALLLELGDAYAAALRSASQMLRGDAETAVGALEGAGRSLVQVLIAKPAMLDELSAIRARLHSLLEEAESLTMRLAQMQGHGGAAAHLLRRVFQSDQAPLDSGAGLSARLTEPDYSGQASRVTAATGLRPFGSTGLRAIDGERLALRILLVQYRRLRLSAADRAEASARFERKAHQLEVELIRFRDLLSEARDEASVWRTQAVNSAEQLHEAATAEARKALEHQEEVACLSEKIAQLSEEHATLEIVCAQQATDLEVLTAEVVRMHAASPEWDGALGAR